MNNNLITYEDGVEFGNVIANSNIVTSESVDETCNEFNTNCLALTIRKDYRFTVFSNVVNTVRRVSFKVLVNFGLLNFFSVIF